MTTTNTTAKLLDGKAAAKALREETEKLLAELKARHNVTPGLRVIQVGNDPASSVYTKKKAQMAQKMGIDGQLINLPETVSQQELLDQILQLNDDPAVHAILLQLPLPPHLDALLFQAAIKPEKDVDGFHPENLGRLLAGANPYAIACTPFGCLWLMDYYNIDIAGKNAVVVGRSNIVGKPMAQLLLQRHATVTIAHSRTPDLKALTREADILVAAVGIPGLIKPFMVKPGGVVIDVGINRVPETGKLAGDVEFSGVSQVAGAITPVPGGVGPMTIAMLMTNTVKLCALSCA